MTYLQLILEDTNKAYHMLITSRELYNTLNQICSKIELPKVATTKDLNERTQKGLIIMLNKGLFN
tara:strand:+ start:102 stop:296 length:195 start_codon:yes stop_codon:yes gene_type:complete